MLSPPGGSTLEEPNMVPRVNAAVSISPMAHTIEEGPFLAGKVHDPQPELWSLHV